MKKDTPFFIYNLLIFKSLLSSLKVVPSHGEYIKALHCGKPFNQYPHFVYFYETRRLQN